MNANLKTLAIAACLAIGTCTYAQEGFFRPELSYNFGSLSGSDATGAKMKDAVGFAVAGGAYFGAQNEHEIGLLIGTLDFSVSANGSDVGKVKTVPIMATYRYYFGTKADSVRFYLAPTMGYTSIKTSGVQGTSESRFTWGAGLGVLFKVADKIDGDFGYRYIDGLKIKNSNVKATVGTLYAGISFRF